MSRPQQLKDRSRSRYQGMPSSVLSVIGILLILASTSLSVFHSHEAAPHHHDDIDSAIESASSHHSEDGSPQAEGSLQADGSAPLGSSESASPECGLCDLGRRGSSEVALLPEAHSLPINSSGTERAVQEVPEQTKTAALSTAGPRAPPLLSV